MRLLPSRRHRGAVAAAILVPWAAAACWSDVNQAQEADSAAVGAPPGEAGQPGGGLTTPGAEAAGAPGPAGVPVDTTQAGRDTLGVPTGTGTAGGAQSRPPTNPPPAR